MAVILTNEEVLTDLHTCCKCGELKDSSEFYKRGRYRMADCKECCKNKSKTRVIQMPEAIKAKYLVRQALKKGTLFKPKLCNRCKLPLKLEAHHEDYSKPLDVEFLCRSCHTKLRFIGG